MRFLLTFLYLFVSINIGTSLGLTYQKEAHIIEADPAKNQFTDKVFIKGVCSAGHREVVNIYYGELDAIKNLSIRYTNKKGKWRNLSKKEITSSTVNTQSFYAGIRKYSFVLESQEQDYSFIISYQKETSDLMFLASLSFDGEDLIDTFDYKIEVPASHQLHYKLDHTDTANKSVQIETSQQSNSTTHHFFSTKNLRKTKNGFYAPRLRLIVHDKKIEPFDFFNDWYRLIIADHSNLDANTKRAIDEHTAGIVDDASKIKAVFQLVQKKINYISFESGLGAVRPRDVNQVFQQKQGDCKDMGNLLCQALRYLDYESYIAISSTLSHPVDLNFPSLASANHAICVVKLNDKWVYLDATESHGIFGLPSRHIQGRNIFIVNSKQGELHKVEKVSKAKNSALHAFTFTKSGNTLTGEANIELKGLSQLDFIFIDQYTNSKKAGEVIESQLNRQSDNMKISDLQWTRTDSTFSIKGLAFTSKNFTQLQKKTYLSLNFLPRPALTKTTLTKGDEVITYQTTNSHYQILIEFENDIRLKEFEEVHLETEGMLFHFVVKQKSPRQLEIYYQYESEHLLIRDQLIEPYNAIHQLIQTTLKKSIIYEPGT